MTINRSPEHAPQDEHTPLLLKRKRDQKEHLVQFYESDEFLLEMLCNFIETGLNAGETCLLFATTTHLELLAECLQTKGHDLAALRTQGKCLLWDADEILTQILVDGMPEQQRFNDIVGDLLAEAAQQGYRIRVFGEMVVQLWTRGNPAAAMHLEKLWNELQQAASPFSLLCVYPMNIFAGEKYREAFTTICQQHSHVLPNESYPPLANPEERQRAIALLQQKAASLEIEIEERKKTEERLRASENHYRQLFEASTDGILMLDALTGTIIDANPCIAHMMGYKREKLLGRELWHLGLFQDQQANLEALQELQAMKIIHYAELALRMRGRKSLPVEFTGILYQANGSQVIQCILRDITDRKQAAEAHLFLASIVESSEDAILSKNLRGIITSWNPAAERMYGYSAQEIVGQPVSRLFLPERTDEFTSIMERIRRGKRVDHYETQRRHKDGHILNISVAISPIKDSNGTIIGASTIARDISKRKELEHQHEAFIGFVTHELRNPLTALQGNVQVAQHLLSRLQRQPGQLTEEQQRILEDVLLMLARSQQPLRVQRRLIDDLLDQARIQQDQVELRLEIYNLVKLVHDVVQDHQAAYPSRLIMMELPKQDPLPVYIDRDRITQVLGNYLTNALKFAPPTLPVRVGIRTQATTVQVWVQDQGPGLTLEQREHIWERFPQAVQTPLQEGWKAGLGLGLYLCQQLINRQQGEVGVKSTPGQGATFWFTLPLSH